MHEDRDHYIIVMSLLPVVVAVGLFSFWHDAGEPPVSFPSIGFLPSFTVPLPKVDIPMPPVAGDLGTYLGNNWETMLPAVAIGVVIGLLCVGTLIDVTSAFRGAFRARRLRAAPAAEEDAARRETI